MYTDARYRAALRRARRRYRYGRRITWWQAIGLGIVAVAMLSGAFGKIAHTVTGGGPATVSAPSGQAATAIAYARHQLGCPYAWGGTGPCSAGYDCSGLVMEAYASAGVTIPRTSQEQWAGLRHVTSPHRGDLVFFAGADGTPASPGHVGIVIRAGLMMDAYSSGYPVTVESYGQPTSREGLTNPVGYARPVPLAHTVTVAAGGSYTARSWAVALLRDGGWPRTSCNLGAVTAWQAAEGDWTVGHAGWRNPLNDTHREPGSQNKVQTQHPGIWVQSYTSWGQGFTATLATLTGPDYGPIRTALAAGNNAQSVANAVGASPWGTQPFTAEC